MGLLKVLLFPAKKKNIRKEREENIKKIKIKNVFVEALNDLNSEGFNTLYKKSDLVKINTSHSHFICKLKKRKKEKFEARLSIYSNRISTLILNDSKIHLPGILDKEKIKESLIKIGFAKK